MEGYQFRYLPYRYFSVVMNGGVSNLNERAHRTHDASYLWQSVERWPFSYEFLEDFVFFLQFFWLIDWLFNYYINRFWLFTLTF